MSQTKAQLIDTLVASLLPASDSAVDIGSNAVRFANIYGDTLYGSGANLTGLNIVTDTSPQLGGTLDANGQVISFGDSSSASENRLKFGASNDLSLYHQSNSSYILNTTGNLNIASNNEIRLKGGDDAAEHMGRFIDNGAVELYYDASKKFETTSTGATVTGILRADEIRMGDSGGATSPNERIRLGNSEDLEIYHDGSNSFIDDTGTGNLVIRSSTIAFENAPGGGESLAKFIGNGAVELYYDNVKTFHTKQNGVVVEGTEGAGAIFEMRADEGDDNNDYHRLFADGTVSNLYFQNYASGSWETNLRTIGNGTVELWYDNSKKFETTSSGVAITGGLTASGSSTFNADVFFVGASSKTITFDQSEGHIRYLDNAKAQFGTQGDLNIFHDGSNSIIRETGTGSLFIESNTNIFLGKEAGAETYIKAIPDGAVELYHDNIKSLETTTEGIEIKKTASGQTARLKIEATNGGQAGIELRTSLSGTNRAARIDMYNQNALQWSIFNDYQQNGTNDFSVRHDAEMAIRAFPDAQVELYYDNSKKLETTSGGVDVTGRLMTDGVFVPDGGNTDVSVSIGSNNDLRLYHEGNHSYIIDRGTGELRIGSDSGIRLTKHDSETVAFFDPDGQVELYYDNNKKFETLSTGVTISNGGLNVQRSSAAYSGAIYWAGFGDTNHMVWQDHQDNPNGTRGTGNGFDGIKWNTYAGIYFYGNGNEAEKLAVFLANGACELYYDNSKKLNTHPNGIFVQGIYPMADNTYNIGSSTQRFINIYATSGTVNASDKNVKNTIVNSDLGLDFINKLNPVSYKWNEDDGKTHYGLIAQDVEETLTSIGKTISDFGGLYKEDNSPMGLGYSELIAPLIKAIQELSAEVAALKAA